MDEADTRRFLPPAFTRQLSQRIATHEQGHVGEIKLCVESSLPRSYLWRLLRSKTPALVIRQRALMMFSKLGVWDTERNTGVLIYVLLAEHAIEIVADRGLRAITTEQWQALADELAEAIRNGRIQEGLLHVLDHCEALLRTVELTGDSSDELCNHPHLQ